MEGVTPAPSQCLALGEASLVSALATMLLGQELEGEVVCP